MSELPTTEQVNARVRHVLRDQFGPAVDALADDVPLTEGLDGNYDSLSALDCIARVEAEFGIEVDFVGHDVRHWFASIARIAEFVRDQIEDQAVLGAAR
ncbi:acyl carrier protein [Lentzea albidocapillata]|uniref:Acyl carrier protein n=1 Tax=Lentzea albidocapillata TaxID=40571 RepID=A0A1W2ESJ9_9PSEU|nr:acyl carrier protein [Lentzea albidocapillata]SMD12196.1 acyl carrier protein [Lentzea albidocapillata]